MSVSISGQLSSTVVEAIRVSIVGDNFFGNAGQATEPKHVVSMRSWTVSPVVISSYDLTKILFAIPVIGIIIIA